MTIRCRIAGLVILLGLAREPARAQNLALKRSAVRPRPNACPVVAPPRQPAPEQRDEARQRASLAQEAAIVGNQQAAREQFARAAQLDPTNEDITYQYGRTLEDSGSPAEALREYCRYLTLSPAGSDAADVRSRLVALLPPPPRLGAADQATPQFTAGLASYDAARYDDAVRAFSRAIAEVPAWADAHYNRALAYLAARDPARAVPDLRRYIELRPDALDRVAVFNQIEVIERPLPFTPVGALVRGVVPGLGQFYTRRPVVGTTVLVAAAGGLALALQRQEKRETQVRTFRDINNVERRYTIDTVFTVYPKRTAGIAIASGVTAIAAIESYIYARRTRSNALRGVGRRSASIRVLPVPALDPGATAVAVNVRLLLPRASLVGRE